MKIIVIAVEDEATINAVTQDLAFMELKFGVWNLEEVAKLLRKFPEQTLIQ